MANPDTAIDGRILESARKEFLLHGYEGVSLKTICENASVTTGALYKRYSGKEELFAALVVPTIEDLHAVMEMKNAPLNNGISDEALMQAWKMEESYMLWWFDFLCERRDGFELLLNCSAGTKYANFQHMMVEDMTRYTYQWYMEAFRRGLTTVSITEKELHALLTSFWTMIYEPFIHGFSKGEIVDHSQLVCRLFDWYNVLGFPK